MRASFDKIEKLGLHLKLLLFFPSSFQSLRRRERERERERMERSSEEVNPSEAAVLINPRTDPIRHNQNLITTSSLSSRSEWPTIDGPLGLSEQDAVGYARKFFGFGFVLLPLLWAVNCYYFSPVLRHPRSFPQIRPCKLISVLICQKKYSRLQ